jgi:dephospho-CoA kinase
VRRSGYKPVIGVIGAIGAGKSTVAGMMASKGGFLIDADKIGHDVLELPEVREQLRQRWGNVIFHPQGSVNRRAVSGIVFQDPAERRKLESIVFPWIDDRIEEACRDPATKFIVLDAAVLLEADWNHRVDRLIYVDAPIEDRLRRLDIRSGWTVHDLNAREKAQLPAEIKKQRADMILQNDGTIEKLELQVKDMVERWKLDEPRS